MDESFVEKSEQDWRAQLSRRQFRVLRRGGTELPFTGKHLRTNGDGVFECAGCGAELFDSSAKYSSGTGWPSFFQPMPTSDVRLHAGPRGRMGTEVSCGRCGGHLGHVFGDGPAPTAERYCINSAALDFVPRGEGRR